MKSVWRGLGWAKACTNDSWRWSHASLGVWRQANVRHPSSSCPRLATLLRKAHAFLACWRVQNRVSDPESLLPTDMKFVHVEPFRGDDIIMDTVAPPRLSALSHLSTLGWTVEAASDTSKSDDEAVFCNEVSSTAPSLKHAVWNVTICPCGPCEHAGRHQSARISLLVEGAMVIKMCRGSTLHTHSGTTSRVHEQAVAQSRSSVLPLTVYGASSDLPSVNMKPM